MCRSLPQMLVVTSLRMTACSIFRPCGSASLGYPASRTSILPGPMNVIARLLAICWMSSHSVQAVCRPRRDDARKKYLQRRLGSLTVVNFAVTCATFNGRQALRLSAARQRPFHSNLIGKHGDVTTCAWHALANVDVRQRYKGPHNNSLRTTRSEPNAREAAFHLPPLP